MGLLPEVVQSWLLTRRLGYQRAFELYATGRHLSAREAHDLGLTNAVVAHEQLIATALQWCSKRGAPVGEVLGQLGSCAADRR